VGRKSYKNAEGYPDPTAGALFKTETDEEIRLQELIRVLKWVIRAAGFEPISRIELISRKSGRVYR